MAFTPIPGQGYHTEQYSDPVLKYKQYQESRGIYSQAIAQYLHDSIVRYFTVRTDTLDKMRERGMIKSDISGAWPFEVPIATDYLEGLFQVKSPYLRFSDLSGQSSAYKYYDIFGRRNQAPSARHDIEYKHYTVLRYAPAIFGVRFDLQKFDEYLVQSAKFQQWVDMLMRQKVESVNLSLNAALWDSSKDSYAPDNNPQNLADMGNIPFYVNSLSFFVVSKSGVVPGGETGIYMYPFAPDASGKLPSDTPIGTLTITNKISNPATGDQRYGLTYWYRYHPAAVNINTARTNQAAFRDLLLNTQVIGGYDRGYDVSATSGIFDIADYYNPWYNIPSLPTMRAMGIDAIEMSQVVAPYDVTAGSNWWTQLPRMQLVSDGTNPARWEWLKRVDLVPTHFEQLYYACAWNGMNPGLLIMRPEIHLKLNQYAMTATQLHQPTATLLGPIEFGKRVETYKDAVIVPEKHCPEGIVYYLNPDGLKLGVDFSRFVPEEQLYQDDFVRRWKGDFLIKLFLIDARKHGMLWGVQ